MGEEGFEPSSWRPKRHIIDQTKLLSQQEKKQNI